MSSTTFLSCTLGSGTGVCYLEVKVSNARRPKSKEPRN